MKPAAIYARVSTQEQADAGTSLTTQLEACRQYAQTHGYIVVFEATDDKSGTTLARPGLDAIRNLAAERQIEAILFYKLDRLARDTGDTLTLLKEFRARNVAVESVTVKLEDTPEGKFLLTMLAAVADLERSMIADRMRRGKEGRAREGRVLGSNWRAFGYHYIKGEGRVEVDEEEAGWVRRIFDWCLVERLPLHQIALRLTAAGVKTTKGNNRWATSSVRHLLRNEMYGGIWYYNRTLTKGQRGSHGSNGHGRALRPREQWIAVPIPAIVPMELIEQATAQLTQNQARAVRNSRFPYLLRGLALCSLCGARLIGVHRGYSSEQYSHTDFYYACRRSHRDPSQDPAVRCPNSYVSGPMLEEAVWEAVGAQLGDTKLIEKTLASVRAQEDSAHSGIQGELARLDAQERVLQKEADTLLDVLLAGEIDRATFSKRTKSLRSRLLAIAGERAALERRGGSQEAVVAHLLSLRSAAARVAGSLTNATWEQKREFLEDFDLTIRADGNSRTLEIDGLVEPVRLTMSRTRRLPTRYRYFRRKQGTRGKEWLSPPTPPASV